MEAVKLWMIDNQNGRRNLTDGWKWELVQDKKEILLEKGREKQSFKGIPNEERVMSTIDRTPHSTRNEIAKDFIYTMEAVKIGLSGIEFIR